MTGRKVRAAALAIMGAYFSMCADGQAPSRSMDTSNLWEKMDDGGKFGYVLGFSNASEYYQMVLRAMCFNATSNDLSGCTDETKDRITATLEQNPVSHATLAQWKSVLDEFYQDPRNKGIFLVSAMQIASLRIAGRPQSEIDGQLRRMRELATKP